MATLNTPKLLVIGGTGFNSFNGNIISGSIFQDSTYNNLVINLSNNSCVLNQFGSSKTDILIGNIGENFFGYKIGSVKGINSTVMIFSDIDDFLSVDIWRCVFFVCSILRLFPTYY